MVHIRMLSRVLVGICQTLQNEQGGTKEEPGLTKAQMG